MKYFKSEPLRSVVFLCALVCLKLVFQAVLFSQGFISVSADEFSRGIRAAEWASQPNFNILADVQDPWLPFEKYLNGSLLLLWPDVIWAPRFTVFIASCFVLITFFILVYYLFNEFSVAALAGIFVVCQPWYTWLSGTPMLEMYYLACFLGGLAFLVMWLREFRRGYWFWAGCCFMLASGFHVQSWVYINLVNLITVAHLYQYMLQKRFGYVSRLIGFYILSNLLIITFSIIDFLNTGHFFTFLIHHTVYSKWFYNGYNVSFIKKLFYYPNLTIHNSSPTIWVSLLVALFFLLHDQAPKWKLLPLTIAMLALIMNSVMNVVSVPATAAPARFSLFYVVMLSPYLAYGTYRLWILRRRLSSGTMTYTTITMLSIGLFLYSILWGIVRIPNFPHGMSTDAIKTGYRINQMLTQNESDNVASYMVELKYWDFLAVQLTAGHYAAVVYDREYNDTNRNKPSIFLKKMETVCASLISHNVRYVALRDPNLKANARLINCLHPIKEIGHWTIYEFYSGH